MPDSLGGKRVTVMGLGVHGGGIGTVEWLVKQGAEVTVTDLRSEAELRDPIEALGRAGLAEQFVGVWGEHREADFTEADIVVRNPAVPRDSRYIELARAAGAVIEMDSSLLLKNVPDRSRVIGVTGTRGKSTTTHVIGQLMRLTGDPVVVTGIEGTSPLGDLLVVDEKTWVVIELSSWRLEALHEHKLSPGIAVVTSLYRDHLNTYDSFEDYIEAKKAIVRYQQPRDLALLSNDDERVREWEKDIKGELVWYSLSSPPPAFAKASAGKQAGGETYGGDFSFTSVHEMRNVLPGIILARRAGVSEDKIAQAVTQLKGLPHRLELVREINGVKYINDSAATMPDATIAALKAFAGKRIIHILGGNDKELDFSEWAKFEAAVDVKKYVWLPGDVTEKMKGWLTNIDSELTKKFSDVDSMKEAVQSAHSSAEDGDIVLLSPGATSFGLFKHEFDRGDKFTKAVSKL